jgi:hypothetical protein
MGVYPIECPMTFSAEADPRSSDLGIREVDRYNGWSRRIGGDKGDLLFNGYDVVDGETVLRDPAFCTVFDDLTDQEVLDYAHQVVHEAFAAIGTECVQ